MVGDRLFPLYLLGHVFLVFHAILFLLQYSGVFWVLEQKYKKYIFSGKQILKILNSVSKMAVSHGINNTETTDSNISLQNSEYGMWYFANYEQGFRSASGSLILWSYEPYEKSCLVLSRIWWGFGTEQTLNLPSFCCSVDIGFFGGVTPGYLYLHKMTLLSVWVFSNQVSRS